LGTAVAVMLILQGALWGNKLVAFAAKRIVAGSGDADGSAMTTIAALIFTGRIVLWAVVALLILENLGVDVTSLIAGLGVAGIAVALAVQNLLGDIFASLSIYLDKPFVVGDFIIVADFMGVVEHTGLKTTRLRSLNGEQLVLGNADLLSSRIRNLKRMNERRALFTVTAAYETPVEKVARIPGML